MSLYWSASNVDAVTSIPKLHGWMQWNKNIDWTQHLLFLPILHLCGVCMSVQVYTRLCRCSRVCAGVCDHECMCVGLRLMLDVFLYHTESKVHHGWPASSWGLPVSATHPWGHKRVPPSWFLEITLRSPCRSSATLSSLRIASLLWVF